MRRRSAALTLAVGLVGIVFAQVAAPLQGPPLYDGVLVVPPYVWLSPPPGEQGGALGASAVLPVNGGSSPLITVATPEENAPQAQIFATPGAMILTVGTTSLTVSITPVPPEAQPTDGHIAGNVYRITITNQDGTAATAQASAEVSISLRDPDSTATDGTISLLSNGTWQPLKSDLGLGGAFEAVVTNFGDFAVIEPGGGASAGPSEGVASAGPGSSAGPGASTGAGSSAAAPASLVPVAPLAPGIPTVTIVAGIAAGLVLLGLIVLALLPRRPKRRAWGEGPDRGSRRRPRR